MNGFSRLGCRLSVLFWGGGVGVDGWIDFVGGSLVFFFIVFFCLGWS